MDPLSIVASCAGLATAIGTVSRGIASFVQTVRGARSDLEDVYNEFESLKMTLMTVSGVFETSGRALSPQYRNQIYGVIGNCFKGVEDIHTTIRKYSGDSLKAAVEWARRGKDDVKRMRESLIGHRGALELGLQVLSLQNSKDIKSDTHYIRQEVDKVVSLLHDKGVLPTAQQLRARTLIDRYLDDLDTFSIKRLGPDLLTVTESVPSRWSDSRTSKSSRDSKATNDPGGGTSQLRPPQTDQVGISHLPKHEIPGLSNAQTSTIPSEPPQQSQSLPPQQVTPNPQPAPPTRASINKPFRRQPRTPQPSKALAVIRSQPVAGLHGDLHRGQRDLHSPWTPSSRKLTVENLPGDMPHYSTCPSFIGSWLPPPPSGSFDTIASSVEDELDREAVDDDKRKEGAGDEKSKDCRPRRKEGAREHWFRKPTEMKEKEKKCREGEKFRGLKEGVQEKERDKGAPLPSETGSVTSRAREPHRPSSRPGMMSSARRALKTISRARNVPKMFTQ